jgi:hypothetical protein
MAQWSLHPQHKRRNADTPRDKDVAAFVTGYFLPQSGRKLMQQYDG